MSPVRSGAGARRVRAGSAARVPPLLAALVLALLGASCATRSSGIGAPESPCFRSLAAASAAVHATGRFAGVRYLTSHQLAVALRNGSKAPPAMLPPELVRDRDRVCVVAYRGEYGPSHVSVPWPPTVASARLAVVVVRQRNSAVVVTILLEKEPVGFARVFPAIGGTPVLR
jgi:hypothetical protein